MESQVVIITGGAQGIGFGIGKCFAASGASIVIADLNGEGAENAAEELDKMGAVDSVGMQCDITDPQQVQAMTDKTVGKYGRIDVLVNNAGICPYVDIMEIDPETFRKTIDVNLMGSFYCTQTVARKMIARGKGGRIIFITSLAENVTGPTLVDYGASKGGLRMLMVGFATRLGREGITCNAIAPGMILTELTAWNYEKPEIKARMKERIPMGRIGTPEDIGKVAVFLASEDAEYVDGMSIRVDGGHQTRCK